jgi:hypothetical protein
LAVLSDFSAAESLLLSESTSVRASSSCWPSCLALELAASLPLFSSSSWARVWASSSSRLFLVVSSWI